MRPSAHDLPSSSWRRPGAPSRPTWRPLSAFALLVVGCAGKAAPAPTAPPAPATAAAPAVNPAPAVTPAAAVIPTSVPAAVPWERPLPPAELDPAADRYPAVQYAYLDPGARPLDRLVVYLVGANNPPERGRAMGRWLAEQGLHVLVPGYANDYDIRSLCQPAGVSDADCHAKLRLEAFEGADHSPHIVVSRANSLEARVGRMLEHLARAEPQARWGRFVARGLPRWEVITVGGHSHGASSSALIGKVRRVDRVVMLSGPFDNRDGAPAPWLRRRPLTPLARVYGFSHAREEQYPGHIKNWQALELPRLGALVEVDGPAPSDFGGSHQLVTGLRSGPGEDNPHGMTTAGRASPRLPDGTYHFAPVWRYLFGVPSGPPAAGTPVRAPR